MLKKVVIGAIVAVGILAGIAFAERAQQVHTYTAAPVRLVNAGNPQRFDTLNVTSGERLAVDAFTVWADDSAQTPTLQVEFMSKNSRTRYLRFTDTYTANQVKATWWAGPWVFPTDSSVIVTYYTANGTLDSLLSNFTYRLERP